MTVGQLRELLAHAPADALVCLRLPERTAKGIIAPVAVASWDWGAEAHEVAGQWVAESFDPPPVDGPAITLELPPRGRRQGPRAN